MNQLLERSDYAVSQTSLEFSRFLYEKIRWNNRLIGIKGARGTGKTTMLLQWLRQQDSPAYKAAYFTLDDLYFTTNSLKETAEKFHREGGKILLLDEVHKYRSWAVEIKNLYDQYRDLKIIFTGSSIIDISRQEADLSRRAIVYELPGLSFREFLSLRHRIQLPEISLVELIADQGGIRKRFPSDFHPLEYFAGYLSYGYYPFMMDDPETVYMRINQLVRTIIEYDMAELNDFDIRNAKKMLQLLYVIAQQVPFKPNLVKLAERTGIHRNSLNNYLSFLEQAKLISMLYPGGSSVSVLQKPEKIYLNNTSLIYALAAGQIEIGNVRETFFLSQVNTLHKAGMPVRGDFLVDDKYTFEVGGRSKSGRQLAGVRNSWVVRDDMEYHIGHELPLWMFGLLY